MWLFVSVRIRGFLLFRGTEWMQKFAPDVTCDVCSGHPSPTMAHGVCKCTHRILIGVGGLVWELMPKFQWNAVSYDLFWGSGLGYDF